MDEEVEISIEYQRLMQVLESVGLKQADAFRIVGRGLYSYKSPEKSFGDLPLGLLRDVLGINPIFISEGKGEKFLPNSDRLIKEYKISKNVKPLAVTPIEKLPTQLQQKAIELFEPQNFINYDIISSLSQYQILAICEKADELENDNINKIKSVFSTIRGLGEVYASKKNKDYYNTETD